MSRNFLILATCLWLVVPATQSNATPINARDEATCIYDLATHLISQTAWSHLRLENTIYFSDTFRSEREYTIYATSTTTTPRDFKMTFKAAWTVTPVGRCNRSSENPFVVVSSQGHQVVHTLTYTEQLHPSQFPLDPSDEVEPIASFNRERSYGGQAAAAPGTTPAAQDPNAPVTLTFDAETVELLRNQGITIGAELAGAYGLGRLAAPARRSLRVLRTAGRAALAVDAGSRAYLIVGEGANPGIIALPRVAGEVLPGIWSRIQNRLTVTGSMRVPSAYIQQFYEGNQRLNQHQLERRRARTELLRPLNERRDRITTELTQVRAQLTSTTSPPSGSDRALLASRETELEDQLRDVERLIRNTN